MASFTLHGIPVSRGIAIGRAPDPRPIVEKHVTAFFGQPVESLVAHVCKLVQQGASRETITSEVRPILDDDAGAFAADVLRDLAKVG